MADRDATNGEAAILDQGKREKNYKNILFISNVSIFLLSGFNVICHKKLYRSVISFT